MEDGRTKESCACGIACTLDSGESVSGLGLYAASPRESDAPALRGLRGRPQGCVGKNRFPSRDRLYGCRSGCLLRSTYAGWTQRRRKQDKGVGDHNATPGRRGMEEGALPYRAATFMVVDGVAHAPVWIQEVRSRTFWSSLLELEAPGKPLGTY